MATALKALMAMCVGIGSAYASPECVQIEPGEQSLQSKLVEQGYTQTMGGPLKGHSADVMPTETTAMVMVHPTHMMWKVLVMTPKGVTCVYLEGNAWTEGPSQQ